MKMTRPALLLFIGQLLCCTLATGQINKFEVGISGGPSLTYSRGNDGLKEFGQPTFGYAGGVTLQYNFPKIVSLRTNVSYVKKGHKLKIETTDAQGQPLGDLLIGEASFDYLTLPILARVSFGKKFKFFANIGPYFGFLINYAEKRYSFFLEESNVDDFKRFDTGITGGIGVSLTVKDRFIVSLEARHNLGLYNISKQTINNDGSLIPNSAELLIGFAYGFGAKAEEQK